jgi:hypothetical protein
MYSPTIPAITSLFRNLSDSLLYSHSPQEQQEAPALPPLPGTSSECLVNEEDHSSHSCHDQSQYDCQDLSISEGQLSETDEELSDWMSSDTESDHEGPSMRSSTSDSHQLKSSQTSPQQSDMRKQIVQIQNDPSISVAEKSKRIQVSRGKRAGRFFLISSFLGTDDKTMGGQAAECMLKR